MHRVDFKSLRKHFSVNSNPTIKTPKFWFPIGLHSFHKRKRMWRQNAQRPTIKYNNNNDNDKYIDASTFRSVHQNNLPIFANLVTPFHLFFNYTKHSMCIKRRHTSGLDKQLVFIHFIHRVKRPANSSTWIYIRKLQKFSDFIFFILRVCSALAMSRYRRIALDVFVNENEKTSRCPIRIKFWQCV